MTRATIPLLSGITSSAQADFNLSYPVNLEPVPLDSGISKGYVRSAMGATAIATGPGVDRGGIVWNNSHYRVMGTKLVRVDGVTITTLGDVGGSGPVSLERFDAYLAIRSGTTLWYWNGTTLTQVSDPDLGPCLDIVRLNGQLFSTDGTYIVAAQLADPTQFDPLKYGAAESDPDGIVGLIRLRNELYALGSSTIDVLTYAGGSGFPLQLSEGATIPLGVCGTQAKVRLLQTFAFVGGGENQALAVWLADSGTADKISTRAVEDYLAAVEDPSSIALEVRSSRGENRLYVHLPDKTLVYLHVASSVAGVPVWYVARSGTGAGKAYRPRYAVLVGADLIVGDTESAQLGMTDETTGAHFGELVGWQFDTQLLYNSANGGIVHSLELVGLPGRHHSAAEPVAFLSMTRDGETWSLERANALGRASERSKRVVWRNHARFRNYMGMRFRGDSSALAGWAALEADIEGLAA